MEFKTDAYCSRLGGSDTGFVTGFAATWLHFIPIVVILGLSTFTGCSTYRGWMRPAPSEPNRYVVPVPDHHATVNVAAPRGWRLDPDGLPVDLGSFTHPEHVFSPIVVSTEAEFPVKRTTSQTVLYERILAEKRRTEPERLAELEKFISGIPSAWRPRPIRHDRVTWKRLNEVTLPDGRRIWISRFDSALNRGLHAYIPEDGFMTNIFVSLESRPSDPAELLKAIATVAASYRCDYP